MYIAPNSEIRILSGVPLDNTYEHTIAWKSKILARDNQAAYFLTKTKYAFSEQYYQRVERGWLKININPDDLWDCNYMMFKNTSFKDKWFYAFILSIEYVNNATAKINYEIDVMQTWLRGENFDYELEPCFIDRQHTISDNMYENLVPEEVSTKNSYVINEEISFDLTPDTVVVLSTERYNELSSRWIAPPARIDYGVYSSLWMEKFTLNELREITAYVNKFIEDNKEDSIICIMMFSSNVKTNLTDIHHVELSKPKPKQALGWKGKKYTPKNNKIYTYPFIRACINNQTGDKKEYLWENWKSDRVRGVFYIWGTDYWVPAAIAYPSVGYLGEEHINAEDCVVFNSYPISPWSGNAFKAWWAQNMPYMAIKLASSGADLLVGALTNNSRSIISGAGGIANLVADCLAAEKQPNQAHNYTNAPLLLPALQNMRFTFTFESFKPEILEIYDNYFTKFGYAIKTIGVPGYINRQRWTYVKTNQCAITSKINNQDSKKITEIYDKGITFWTNPFEIGNYNLENKPLNGG